MSNRSANVAAGASVSGGGVADLDRWVFVPIVVGAVFAGIQVQHLFEMFYYGTLGVVLEAVVPLVLAVGLAVTGPWLFQAGYGVQERRRVTGWMGFVAVLVALLFGWGLSHQFILGYSFPHARYVTTTTLIAGSLLGLVVGIYDVRSRRHRRAIEAERETVVQQRARLSVLNRVLRHNLRNEAGVVMGLTETLADRTSGDVADLADTAHEKTEDLVALGEKAREIERITDVDRDSFEAVDLEGLVTAVVGSHRQSVGDAEFAVDVSPDLRVVSSRRVLSRVLDELVENAVEHVHATPLRVRVSAAAADGWVEVVVADNGTGIPAHERESIEEGVETALDHGSGLGLWLANWGVATLGGELSVEESEWGGTAVRIRLPGEDRWSERSGTDLAVEY